MDNRLVGDFRIVFVGFGHFGREAEKLLRDNVGEVLIIGKESQYLEKFTQDEAYNQNVWVLKGDIDETSIDEALSSLGIVPEEEEGEKGEKVNGGKKFKGADVAIVDMEDLGAGNNDHAVSKVSDYAAITVASTRSSSHMETLQKLGASESGNMLVVCPEKESAESLVLRLHGIEVHDLIHVSPGSNMRTASVNVPNSITGRTFKSIEQEFGVRILFVVRSDPVMDKAGKKIISYHDRVVFPGDADDERDSEDPEYKPGCVLEKDSLMRVLGTFSQIRNLGRKIK